MQEADKLKGVEHLCTLDSWPSSQIDWFDWPACYNGKPDSNTSGLRVARTQTGELVYRFNGCHPLCDKEKWDWRPQPTFKDFRGCRNTALFLDFYWEQSEAVQSSMLLLLMKVLSHV